MRGTSPSGVDVLERARRLSGLSMEQLWVRYFALGGMSSFLQVDAYLHGALLAKAYERDLLAVALNERFAELGSCDPPVPYASDDPVSE